MFCYRCNNQAGYNKVCPTCGANLVYFQKARKISNAYYNDGLEKASVRNISGAISSLKRSLKFNKYNTDARNLLGLCFLEIGETVQALGEWVVSKNYQPEDNRASLYLEAIQNNKGRLDAVNQTIKKYNQALLYCKQDSRDLAIIQLKKVLGLNPKLIKAQQLLALLYLQEGKFDQAKKILKSAIKIDCDNTTTLRYIKEINRRIKEEHPERVKRQEDMISYQSGNETIITPKRIKQSPFQSSIAVLIAGLALGVLVVSVLFIPSVKRKAKNNISSELLEARETIIQNDQMIKSQAETIQNLEEQLGTASDSSEASVSKSATYNNFALAYDAYLAKDMYKAGEYLTNVNENLLTEEAKVAYETLNGLVGNQYLESVYTEGYRLYNEDKNFAEAVKNLQKVISIDMNYDNGQAVYYLAQAMRLAGDLEGAKQYYQYVVDNYPGTERARTASKYL